MLTMRRPIQAKSARPMGTLGELFGEKIRANYEQMQGHINPADILHFLSVPPEVYLAETGMTTLVNQKNNTELQKLELNLVNNVLNRILASGHLALTYQDRVFVENVLKKLGVTDVREWMRQVRIIKEEARNIRELLSLYESGRDAVRLIREYRRDPLKVRGKREKRERQKETEGPAADRLAAAVLRRLQTEKIYREVGGHATFRIGGRTKIDRRELSFGEQSIAAAYLTFSDYRNRFYAQRQGAVHNRADRYEVWNIGHTDKNYGRTVSNLLQAVLLSAVRQLFHIRFGEFTGHSGWRHEFMDALHVSVRNTCQRLAELPAGTFAAVQDRDAWQRTLRYFERQEIDSLRDLLAKSLQTTVRTTYDTKNGHTAAQDRTAVLETHQQDTNTEVIWQDHTQPHDRPPQKTEALRREQEKELIALLERIDRQNVERMERLAEYTRRIGEQGERRIDREKTKVDAVRTIDGTRQGKTVYREREMLHRTETARETEKLREIIGDETVRVFEAIRGYQENPGRYPHVTTSKGQAVNLFLRDIAAAGELQNAAFEAGPETAVYDGAWRADQKAEAGALPETLLGAQPGGRRPERTAVETGQTMELFHRQNAQTISEETLQELLQSRRKDSFVQNTDIRETFRTEEQVTEIVQSKVNEMKGRQDEEIARMISRNVKRQLDTLSEKVYGKLERRMDAERRRRGM